MSPLPPPPELKGPAATRALQAMWQQRTPLAALEVFHREVGDCFRISLPGFRPVMLAGAEACRFALITVRDDLRWRNEADPVAKLLRHGVLVEDGDAHDVLRHAMNPAMHKRMLANYTGAMLRGIDQVTAAWDNATPHDMLVEMRKAALLIVFEALFNHDFAPDLAALYPSIMSMLSYISPGLWMIWRGMPRPGYAARMRHMDDYLFRLIAARRRSTGDTADLLGALISAGLSDDLIRDQLLTMLIAGHDTSTTALAWSLYLLGAHPEAMSRARVEVDAVVGDATPTLEHAGQLHYLDMVIKETLRLYQPIHLGSRIAAIDLDFQGYGIKAGTRVLYSIYLTQRDPRYWMEPERFDPQRFAPDAPARPAYTYLPFGGGPRNCIGYAFAEVELRLVLARLLQRFDMRLTQPNVRVYMGATLEPRPGVMMKVQRSGGAEVRGRKGDWR